MKPAYLIAMIIPAALAVGCHGPSKSDDTDLFHPAQDKADIAAFTDRQAAAATREDATLFPAHFTGPHLNSLGKAKLDLLLQCIERDDVTRIYFPHTLDTDAHRHAVASYLTSHGWKASQFALVSGWNPDSHSSAKQSLSDAEKLDGGSGAPADSGSSSVGMSASASGK